MLHIKSPFACIAGKPVFSFRFSRNLTSQVIVECLISLACIGITSKPSMSTISIMASESRFSPLTISFSVIRQTETSFKFLCLLRPLSRGYFEIVFEQFVHVIPRIENSFASILFGEVSIDFN